MLRQSWTRSTPRYISAGVHAQAKRAKITNQSSHPRSRRARGCCGTPGGAPASSFAGAAATSATSTAIRPLVGPGVGRRELGDYALHVILTTGLFGLDERRDTAAERVDLGLFFQFVELGELGLDDGDLLRLLLIGELGVGLDLEKIPVRFHLAGRKQLVVRRGMKRRPDEISEQIPGGFDFRVAANVAVAHQDRVELALDSRIEVLAPHQRIERNERRR